MSGISRRRMLAGTAAFGTAFAGTGVASAHPRRQQPSSELSDLIEKHAAAYAAFMAVVRKPDHTRNDHAAASLTEERALVAVCGFAAASAADRRAKAAYLLPIEARGELDLSEHMQALLLSM